MSDCPSYENGIQLTEMPSQPIPWHVTDEQQVLCKLQTSLSGLDAAQVEERRREFGTNALPERKPPTLLGIVLHQFTSPLIYILMAAAVIAAATGDTKDTIFIMVVILLNAAIGASQEWKAEQGAHALQQLLRVRARVRREGQQLELNADELVPGDVVLLESGARVPADLRLMQANNLSIDEAFLTGESVAAAKRLSILEREVPVSDRRNMAYAGSTVAAGRGVGLVIATGRYTEVGKIARTVAEEAGAKAPLVVRMEAFARQISLIVLGFAVVLGALAFARGMAFREVLFLVIAMAVSAIPEGLPVAMTVALSLSTGRMAKRSVIVRRLTAVESLGSCTVIASDKTGTLTVNQQTVRTVLLPDDIRAAVSGEGYNGDGSVMLAGDAELEDAPRARLEAIARAGMLCNEANLDRAGDGWKHSGDAMDVAMLALGYKLGLNPHQVRERDTVLAEIPYESENRYSAVLCRLDGQPTLIVKGAVETVLRFCKTMAFLEGEQPLDAEHINAQALELAGEGYRVLALASLALPADADTSALNEAMLTGMRLRGLFGFIDPLRPEAKHAVETARGAGIRVVMITGDHPATALAIARELGIADGRGQVLTGAEMASIGDVHVPEFYERVKRASVFARVSPDQKLAIVDVLVTLGNFVAVTGDGVNDAPALRKASIGVAMGSGTDVAKDTADIIVADDNFSSIVAGIEEGRQAYANVRKVTMFLIATGLAQLVLIGLAIIIGLPVPLLAIQILWINLVTNGIQDVGLAFEAGESGLMRLPPRPPSEKLINRAMLQQVGLSSLVMVLVCLPAWYLLLNVSGLPEESARASLLTLLVIMQFYHVLNCRSEHVSVFRVPVRNNRVLIIGMLVAFGIHILATELPFLQSLLRTESIPLRDWALFFVIGAVMIAVLELFKWAKGRRSGAYKGV